jgi:hypothetical protein
MSDNRTAIVSNIIRVFVSLCVFPQNEGRMVPNSPEQPLALPGNDVIPFPLSVNAM